MCCKRRSLKSIENFEESFNKRFVGWSGYTRGHHSKFSYLSVELSLIPGVPSGPAKSRAGGNQAVINIDF